MSTKIKPDQKKSDKDARDNLSLSIFIREDEIFTGEEAVFTLKFTTKEKMQNYFPKTGMENHEFFVKSDIKKPAKTRIIVRAVHPETKKILVMYANITRHGPHPRKPDQQGIYYKIAQLDLEQISMIQKFIA